jgi:translation initiation factor IF-2
MSVRIYQLSKQLDMTNKDLIALLQERGLKVDSPSNTIPDIYADSLIDEFKPKTPSEVVATPAPKEDTVLEKSADMPKPRPLGPVVRSAAQVKEEREQREESKRHSISAPERSAAPVAPKVQPVVPTIKTPGSAMDAPASPKAAPKLPLPPAPLRAGAPKAPPPAPVPVAKSPTVPPFPIRKPASEAGQEPSVAREASDDLKIIQCKPPIVVRDFANLIDVKPFRLISELMELGIFASMNQTIEEDVAQRLAERHGYLLEVRHRGEPVQEPVQPKPKAPEVDESALLEPRPPVVCVLGHVDHGKTTLLDTIRNTSVVKGEAGGITQHIGAYQAERKNHLITFIDTPGHAAFSKMRERGADVTDIAILVVAADDGFMPQTDEALKFAQKAGVPVVVAINKADARGANIDRVKQQMQQRAIAPEDWGGETLACCVSALKGTGIDELLDAVLLQAEMLELRANPKCAAEGTVVESQVEQGRGSTATVIIQKGTLKLGDALVCGAESCKVRAMVNEQGQQIKSAPPSTPVKVIGWTGAPEAGATLTVVKNEREAKRLAETYRHETQKLNNEGAEKQPRSLEALFAAINETQQKVLKVVIKGDVHGSVEALVGALQAIPSQKVSLEVIASEVGPINPNDITLASGSNAVLVGFNVKMEQGVQARAKHLGTQIIQHNIIYELIDRVKDAMADLLDPELNEVKIGMADVRQVFPAGRGFVAGCMVTEGRVGRNAYARLLRKGKMLHQSSIDTLKRFKDDATEVRAGYECGMHIKGFEDYQVGDNIECFEIHEVRATL